MGFHSYIFSAIFANCSIVNCSLLIVSEIPSSIKAFLKVSLLMLSVFETVFTRVFLLCAKQAFTKEKNFDSSFSLIGGSGRILSLITALSTFGGGKKDWLSRIGFLRAVRQRSGSSSSYRSVLNRRYGSLPFGKRGKAGSRGRRHRFG